MLIFAQEPVLGQAQIYSISGRDAALRWKHAFDLASPCSVVQGEIAYDAGYDQKNHTNHIFALHTNDGSILWKTNAPGWDQSESQPVIADGNIYLSEPDASEQGHILAIRASDGKLLWTLSLHNYPTSATVQPLAAGSGLLFVGSTEGIIRAYYSYNGALAWSSALSTKGDSVVLPVFSNEMLFVLSPLTNEVFALRARDKQIQWHLRQSSLSISSLIVEGTHLYLSGSLAGGNDYVYVFDARTSHLLWQQRVVNSLDINVKEVGGVTYMTSQNYFYSLHADTGLLIWQKQEQDNVDYGQPAIINGVIFLKIFRSYCPSIFGLGCSTSSARTMDAFWASNGSPYWEYTTDFAEHNTNVPPGIANYSKH